MLKYLLIGIIGIALVVAFVIYNPNLDIGLPEIKKQSQYGIPKEIKNIYAAPADINKINADLRGYKSMSGKILYYDSGALLQLWFDK